LDPLLIGEVALSAEDKYEHGHVARVLANNPGLEVAVLSAIEGRFAILQSTRRQGTVERRGLTADSLNAGIKKALYERGGWSFEATVREGVVYDWLSPDSKKEGFDLARYDLAANTARMWSLCFGRRRLADGNLEWQRFRERRPDLDELADSVESIGIAGTDIDVATGSGTIFGDIQFGNWGLAYRDVLRLIDADQQMQADLYIYVTGGPTLSRYLSKGIVTFDSIVRILRQFDRLVRVPVWVIGLSAADL